METKSLLVKFGTDTKAMEAGFKKADGFVQKHAATFKKVGQRMTVAGAVISGALGMIVKTASDAQETYAKFGTVFKSVSSEAEAASKNLASGYGLSTLAAKDMLGATGDLLTGLGVLPGVALDLSEKTQKLAVDLASFTNFSGGAKGASEALTKAMLGERESIKSLGIVVTEEMVKEKLLAEGKGDLTGLARKQAAAEATLAICYEQSKNAIGDYERTSDSLANVSRTLKARFEDLTAEIGAQLIPVVTDIAIKIKAALEKVTAWVKENPKLTGTIVKIAAAVGILSTVLGPLVMMLPGLATLFSILKVKMIALKIATFLVAKANAILGTSFTVALGPISLIVAAIVGLIALVALIVKNWGPITDFFKGLWEKVSSFFVAAFDGIKKKLLDWAIKIAGILAKIPIAKKLAGPWKASLESMRAEMDTTVANVSAAEASITASGKSIGQAWIDAIAGTTQFKNIVAAAKEETGLFKKILAGAGAVMTEFGTKTKDTGIVVAKASTKITGMVKTMVDEIKKLTMDEYKYSKWAAGQKLADRIAAINAEKAAEKAGAEDIKALEIQKNKAIAVARKVHENEMAALDKGHKAAAAERQKTAIQKYTDGYKVYYDNLKAKQDELAEKAKAADEKRLAEQETLIDSLAQLEMGRLQYANWALDQRYEKEKLTSTNLGLLWAEYDAQKKELEATAREEEDAARQQSLQNTLADITNILGQIGSLFRQSLDNKLEMINQEEERRLESIKAQYDVQLLALQGVLDAEKQKTEEVLALITDEYEKKRQHLLDNMEDNEERTAMLEALEQEYQDMLDQARIDREQAEADAAQALIDLEDAKNEAIRIASEDLEIKRAAARKTAAKQEKAVALLAAIVNTAAAVAKALPNIPLAIAVGILGAIQIAIIKAQPLPMKEGGIITRPTVVMAGEAGPEAFIPLNKLGGAGLQPAPVSVKISFYNYGDINNVGDLDEISERLARRLTQQLERGRRF